MQNNQKKTIDYFYALIKWRWAFVKNFFIVAIITALLTFALPVWYQSTTTILPPSEDSSPLGLSSVLKNIPLGGLSSMAGLASEEANVFLAIVYSRTAMEAVIHRFDLLQRWDIEEYEIEKAVKILRKRVFFDINQDGTLSLTTQTTTSYFPSAKEKDQARLLAQNMSNYFISKLDSINKRIKMEKARNTRIFIEKRYFENLDDIHQAEEKMKEFGQEFGIIALPEQMESMIQVLAEIKSMVIQKEIEVDLLKKYVDRDHPDLVRAQRELVNLNNKYNQLLNGSEDQINELNESANPDIIVPFADLPELGVQYARLYREIELQTELMKFLLPEYEQAKIQEAKDTPTVQILDPASLPYKKTRPKRAIIVLVAAFSSILLGIFYVWSRVYFKEYSQENPEGAEKLSSIRELLGRDWQNFKNRIFFKKAC